jgi:hypothetical protein
MSSGRTGIPARPSPVWLHSVFLFLLNLALVWRLFKTEYLDEMRSIEGVFMALARYVRDHFSDTDWWPYWYCGMPFRNAYQPGLPFTTAAVSAITGLSPARSFHMVEAILYALGPVTLYWLARRLSNSTGAGFAAGLLYSLTSPSAWFIGEIRADLGGPFFEQRIHTMVSYGDGPHVTSLTFLPLALLAVHEAMERGRAWRYVVAACALALVPLINWPGIIDLAFAALAYLIAYRTARPQVWMLGFAGVAALAYGMACQAMPPSMIALFVHNVEGMESRYRFSAIHLAYVLGLACAMAAVYVTLGRFRAPRQIQFAAVFLIPPAAIVVAHYDFAIALLAQPNRFHLSMEMAMILLAVFAAERAVATWPALRRPAIAILAAICATQSVNIFQHEKRAIRRLDVRQTSEYSVAQWMGAHANGSRVMVPGAMSFWLNTWSDVPELTGCCDQNVETYQARVAQYVFHTDDHAGTHAAEISLAWLQAFGVQQVAVAGPRSTEPYHAMAHPWKFEGKLQELWRDAIDDVIYRVPQHSRSLAHIVAPGELVLTPPANGIDIAPLAPYLKAIEDPNRPEAPMEWLSNHEMRIRAPLKSGKLLSVQIAYDPDWEARVAGTRRPTRADQLGLLVIDPQCQSSCEVRLIYTGGHEMQFMRGLSAACWIGALAAVAWEFWRRQQLTPVSTR